MSLLKILSYAALAIGTILVLLALLQDFAGVEVFSEPPYFIGVGLAAVGAAMVAGFKRQTS